MGAAAVRLGDTCSGHGGYPPRASTGGSSNVNINGLGAVRVGDSWASHTNGSTAHTGIQSTSSATVKINGLGAARIGDQIWNNNHGVNSDCFSSCAVGSGDVFIG